MMGVRTWEEALQNITPEEVWAARKIRQMLRAFLISDGVEYTVNKSKFPQGYGGLKRLQIRIGQTDYVIRSGEVPDSFVQLWLALDETIWSFSEEMVEGHEHE